MPPPTDQPLSSVGLNNTVLSMAPNVMDMEWAEDRPGDPIRDEMPVWGKSDTPLLAVCAQGDAAAAQALLADGADAKERNAGFPQLTALMVASQHGHAEVIQALLKAGAPVACDDQNGYTALMHAAVYGHAGAVKLLAGSRVSGSAGRVNVRTARGATSLMMASEQGHAEVVAVLLGAGADVNAKDYKGCTALIWASWRNQFRVARALLDAGADLGARETSGDPRAKCKKRLAQLHAGPDALGFARANQCHETVALLEAAARGKDLDDDALAAVRAAAPPPREPEPQPLFAGPGGSACVYNALGASAQSR
jgi:ankyrin repeat protein